MAAVEQDLHDESDWQRLANYDRIAETTSSEDELLSATTEDAEEAATWLMDVGLEKIVDILMESNQQLTEASLAATVLEEGFTINQLKTVKQRVNTIRFTQKGRKNRLGTGHQRPDCRDIFRDPEASGGSSGRSRSATPDSLDSISLKNSTENLLSPTVSPKTWSRSGSRDDTEVLSTLFKNKTLGENKHDGRTPVLNNNDIFPDYHSTPSSHRSESKRRRSFNQIDGVRPSFKNVMNVKPSRPGFFSPTAEGHVAAVDKQGVEIVKFKLVGTLSSASAYGKRSNSDPFQDVSELLPVVQQKRISLDEGLTHAQKRKLRQLALLELTTLMDKYGLAMRKRSRLRVRNFTQSSKERNVFGVPLKKLVEKDEGRTPQIFSMMIDQLQKKHLDEEGLLRISGNKQKINALQKLIENHCKNLNDAKGLATIKNAFQNAGPHEIACLLKLFLRQLPESLFTQDCLELFAQVGDISNLDDQMKALNLLIIQLPDPNYQTLRLLLRFLADVVDHQDYNRMTANNIATVMGPNLFPPRISKAGNKNNVESLANGMAYTSKTNHITEILLTHQDDLFSIPPEILSQLSLIKVK